MDSHPNFEIRIFNPFARRSMRFIDGITSFSRINRRMHNKSFTVDNVITVVGGRNIADEYFGASEGAKFDDLDVLAIGPVVSEVSSTFDMYWNHERSASIAAFANMPTDPSGELIRHRAKLEMFWQESLNSRYAEAITGRVVKFVGEDKLDFLWAPYVLAVDSPDKSYKSKAANAKSIKTDLLTSLLSADNEIVIVSPYFVPLKSGIEKLLSIRNKGVDITIITNSLSANNQAAVHGGYAPSRKPLLRSGIKIYEVRDDAAVSGSEFVATSSAKATLHTKVFIVDQKEIFIGSFNFDPRSANINTELGIIIKSPEIAKWATSGLSDAVGENAFEVFLNADGQLRWKATEDGKKVVYDKEPHTTWAQRFVAGFMRMLPIRGEL